MKFLPLLPLLLCVGAALAQSDPLKSPACEQALAALAGARAADPAAAQVPALRGQAAQACLGGGQAPRRSARVLRAPIVVPPPVIAPPAVAEPAAPPPLPPPPVAVGRPPGPVLCDAGGCWTEDGGRLRHLGPGQVFPGALCGSPGALVYCP